MKLSALIVTFFISASVGLVGSSSLPHHLTKV
jgi:hypothetical protein